MATRDRPSFRRMARARPVRTAVFTLGPLAVGVAQLLNATVHGTGLVAFGAIAAAMAAFSVLVTRYHLTVFRRRTLDGGDGVR